MSSAWSITEAVNPPRAAFLDFPLGHTAGRSNEPAEQTEIMSAALKVFTDASCGSITSLPFEWAADDDWKADVMSGQDGDDRVERLDTPQYQSAEDARRADQTCPTCVWL